MRKLGRVLLGVAALLTASAASAAPVLTFTQISTAFSQPIGIDYYEPTNQLILSANYPSGSPHNLEIVAANGAHAAYSSLSGLTDELKIATVRSGYSTGFAVGTTFTGNGQDGQIVKVAAGGGPVSNPWVTLTGGGHGLFRGSLYVDRTGVFNGDLIGVTTAGEVWRFDASGVGTQVDDVGVHLEGLATVPNIPSKWGAIAGCIIAGAEQQGLMHAWCPNGVGGYNHATYNLGIQIEDIDFIDGGNFFGINYGTGKLVGVAASQFAGMVGDILLTQENPTGTGAGLFHLSWNGASFVTEQFAIGTGSTTLGQWEHVTFANAGVREIPPITVPLPGTAWLAGLALALMTVKRRPACRKPDPMA